MTASPLLVAPDELTVRGKTITVKLAATALTDTVTVTVYGVDVPKKISDYRFGVTMQYEDR